MLKYTKQTDVELFELVEEELHRQETNIEMIASESTAPIEVLELSGCIFTNKTLEGYIGSRFQSGAQIADKLEDLANQRAKDVFKAEHANLQVYSGSTANYAVYSAILNPNDIVLSMRLDHGGHLTHGSPANFLSDVYDFHFYGVNEKTELLDYDELARKAQEIKPKLIIAGCSSYSRLIDYERIAKIAKEVGSYFLVDMAHISGLVAAGVIPSPIPHADFVTSSTSKTFCGPRSGMIFCKEEHAKALDKGVFPGSIGSAHLNTLAAKAFCFKHASTPEFKNLMSSVLENAKILADELIKQDFRLISNGTDNHLVAVDLRNKNITGKDMQDALDYIGITVNKNQIPFDSQSPLITSGMRIGVTSITQRGLKAKEIKEIVSIMNTAALNYQDKTILDKLKNDVTKLISNFPLYPKGSLD